MSTPFVRHLSGRAREEGSEDMDSAYAGSETISEGLDTCRNTSIRERATRNLRRKSVNECALEHQLKYNHDRHEILRSIQEASKIALDFRAQAAHTDWPMQVPLICTSEHKPNRPGCVRNTTMNGVVHSEFEPRPQISRSATSGLLDVDGLKRPEYEREPAVLSVEINQQLQILRPEIMMAAHEENIIHTMNPNAVGEIMKQQFTKVRTHLEKLSVRVEDTASKVLITGDLNAGKSTFCNALLRRHLLPVDQQPCTEVFCEILDSRENEGTQEVHAVLHDETYDRNNAASYKRLTYDDLQDAIQHSDQFSLLKVFVDDRRPLSESLLRNGVVDISLIDAPGLNSDSLKTTAVYARQEEIDVIVFVVSAENHFTLSAKQFLWNAANEKAYLFIVVNRFDNIRDQDRCRRLILDQVAKLSPKTFQDANELVHFVSAAKIIDPLEEDVPDAFMNLEVQLRNFVLNKRSQSKLAPAKNFVGKFWSDVKAIATYNHDIALEQNIKLRADLREINNKLRNLNSEQQVSIEQVSQESERACQAIRQKTKENIIAAARSLEALKSEHKYRGVLSCYAYASALCDQYLQSVLSATIASESSCRQMTSLGVESIRAIGLRHLNAEQYKLKPFNVQLMFSRKKDAIGRNLPVQLRLSDFVDIGNFEAIVGTSSVSAALVLYGGKTLGWTALVDTSLRVLSSVGIERSPKLIGLAAASILVGFGSYVVFQVPTALRKNLSKKIHDQIIASDYIETNAHRIVSECRKVLQVPENELRLAFASMVDAEQRDKSAIEKQLLTTTATIEFFKRQNQVIHSEERRLDGIIL